MCLLPSGGSRDPTATPSYDRRSQKSKRACKRVVRRCIRSEVHSRHICGQEGVKQEAATRRFECRCMVLIVHRAL